MQSLIVMRWLITTVPTQISGLLIVCLCGVLQAADLASIESHAPWVSCAGSDGQALSSREVRTDPIGSRTGKVQAYAQIQANVVSAGCENSVGLFVSYPGKPFQRVFHQGASDLDGTANSLGPVAWSPDEKWLAVEFGRWFYASDNGSLELLVFRRREESCVHSRSRGSHRSAARKGLLAAPKIRFRFRFHGPNQIASFRFIQ